MIVSITFAGYSETKISKEELRQAIAEMNASLPQPAGIAGTMVSTTINRDTVVMQYILSDEMLRMVANLDIGKNDYKDLSITQLVALMDFMPDARMLIEAIEGNDLTLKMIYDRDNNQNIFNVELTPAELTRVLNGKPDYKKIVDLNLAQGKLLYPVVLGPMTMSDCYLRENKVYYLLIVDESQVDFNAMKENKDNIKLVILNQLKQSGDIGSEMQLYYNASAGYDSVYEYKGSESGESIYVELSREDVLGIVKSGE